MGIGVYGKPLPLPPNFAGNLKLLKKNEVFKITRVSACDFLDPIPVNLLPTVKGSSLQFTGCEAQQHCPGRTRSIIQASPDIPGHTNPLCTTPPSTHIPRLWVFSQPRPVELLHSSCLLLG